MAQTVFITGTSSGIGKATALYFAEQGWNVAATMRSPEKRTELVPYPKVKTCPLDVTDTTSITTAISQAIQDFGHLDVLVNNAGFSVSAYCSGQDDHASRDGSWDQNAVSRWQCKCHPSSPQATAPSVVSSIRKQLQRHLKASTASVFRLHQGASLHSK